MMIPIIVMVVVALISVSSGIGIGYLWFHNSGYDDGYDAGQKEAVKQAERVGYVNGMNAVKEAFDASLEEQINMLEGV
tara:strand:+ start:2335 stop:2568 length:234 start_codon:yes stop_codon:yes gene_type:complete